jgi:hypothetical protein
VGGQALFVLYRQQRKEKQESKSWHKEKVTHPDFLQKESFGKSEVVVQLIFFFSEGFKTLIPNQHSEAKKINLPLSTLKHIP